MIHHAPPLTCLPQLESRRAQPPKGGTYHRGYGPPS